MLIIWFLKQRRTSGILFNFLKDNTIHYTAKSIERPGGLSMLFVVYRYIILRCGERENFKSLGVKKLLN